MEGAGVSPAEIVVLNHYTDLRDIDAPLISRFLDHLEMNRSASVRTRNLRLTAIRSFFDFARSSMLGCATPNASPGVAIAASSCTPIPR